MYILISVVRYARESSEKHEVFKPMGTLIAIKTTNASYKFVIKD